MLGRLLQGVGAVWALIGLADMAIMYTKPDLTEGVLTFGLMFNVLLFILPGLAVLGIGAGLHSNAGRIACVHCDERISIRATVCPHCRLSVPAQDHDENVNKVAWAIAAVPFVAVAIGYHVYELREKDAATATDAVRLANWRVRIVNAGYLCPAASGARALASDGTVPVTRIDCSNGTAYQILETREGYDIRAINALTGELIRQRRRAR